MPDKEIAYLYEIYFDLCEAIEAEQEEIAFCGGNEIYLDNLFKRKGVVRSEILRRRNR